MQCTKVSITLIDGVFGAPLLIVVDASECCEAGELMACEDTEEISFSWVEDPGICTKTTSSTVNGVTNTNDEVVDASECCEDGQLMACEDTEDFSFDWNEAQMVCTKGTISTINGVTMDPVFWIVDASECCAAG